MTRRKRWTVVAFNHPGQKKSVFYRQNVVDLLHAVEKSVAAGANLMSIRGFEEGSSSEGVQQVLDDVRFPVGGYPAPGEIKVVLEEGGFENVEVERIGKDVG